MPKEATQFKPQPNSLAELTLSTRVEKPIDALVRALPNRSEWLRRVITEAARRELMGTDSEPAIADSPEDDKPTRKRKKGGDE